MAQSSGLSRHREAVVAIILVSGAVGLYYFLNLQQPQAGSSPRRRNLHRSNAVRRGQHATARRSVDTAPDLSLTVQAIANLKERNESGANGYEIPGLYETLNLSHEASADLQQGSPLLPCNFDLFYQRLPVESLSEVDAGLARLKIQEAFVKGWLREEYPRGYHIAHGQEALAIHEALLQYGIYEPVIRRCISQFNGESLDDSPIMSPGSFPVEFMDTRQNAAPHPFQTDGGVGTVGRGVHAIDGRETVADDDSSLSLDESSEDIGNRDESQNMMDLVYKVAEDTARRENFIHRGVECNSCGTQPIQGIRYHCSNCADYDLCETCESMQVHAKHHVFYKIRIPAPHRGRIKQITPSWYPGNPRLFLDHLLPKHVGNSLIEKTKMEKPEMDALFDQFRCLAGHEWLADPTGLGAAIDRSGFMKYFVPSNSPPNLIYDRMFAYYDTNADGLIGFEEFLVGVANMHDTSRHARLKRIFIGYDADDDGYVDRKDFLRMLRAYYALYRELTREMVANEDDDMMEEDPRAVIESSAPISTAFPSGNIASHVSRDGLGKTLDLNGDLVIEDGNATLQEDLPAYGNRHEAISNAAMQVQAYQPAQRFRTFRTEPVGDEPLLPVRSQRNYPMLHPDDAEDWDVEGDDPTLQLYGWPPLNPVQPEDVTSALGRNIPIEEIMDSVERARVIYAQAQRLDMESDQVLQAARSRLVDERWRRKQFYTDVEEGMAAPPGYKETDSSDEEDEKPISRQPIISEHPPSSRRPSMRSRSSSKVRFEDDVTDTDHETRSNTSSRSVPIGERWGGFEISEAEKEVGKEILFQAVEQGFNELLDPLFKEKEDQAMEVQASAPDRTKWESRLQAFEDQSMAESERKEEALREADLLRTEELLSGGKSLSTASTPRFHEAVSFVSKVKKRFADQPEIFKQFLKLLHTHQQELTPKEDVHSRVSELFTTAPDLLEEFEQFMSDEEEAPRAAWVSDADGAFQKVDLGGGEQLITDLIAMKKGTHEAEKAKEEELSEQTLALWVHHRRIEEESKTRGGYGKLNFEEFAAKMVEEDEVAAALGAKDAGGEEGKKWAKSASVGRLAFVGSWLELARF